MNRDEALDAQYRNETVIYNGEEWDVYSLCYPWSEVQWACISQSVGDKLTDLKKVPLKDLTQYRIPPDPSNLVDAIQDSIHQDLGKSRAAKSIKSDQ